MTSKYDSLTLKNQLCFPIYLCSKEIIRRYTPMLEEINLTYTQYIVMMFFWEKEKSNVKELGNALLLDSSTLTPLLKKLENKGFITRVRSTKDERNLDIEITKKGMNLRDKALSIPSKMGKCINISNDEATVLYKVINKILLNTQKEEELDGSYRSK